MSGIKAFFAKEWVAWTVLGLCVIAALVMWRSRAPKHLADDVNTNIEQNVNNSNNYAADDYSAAISEITQDLSSTTSGVVRIALKLIKLPISIVSKIVKWIASLGAIGTIIVIVIIVKAVGKRRG